MSCISSILLAMSAKSHAYSSFLSCISLISVEAEDQQVKEFLISSGVYENLPYAN